MYADNAPRSLRSAARVFFGFGSPRLIAIFAVAVTTARLVVGGWTAWDLLVIAAIAAFWPVMETLAHEWILHLKPRTVFGMKLDPYFARSHRAHHAEPWDLKLALLPLRVVITMGPLSTIVFLLAFPTVQLGLTAAMTFHVMGLLYEWTHYLTHTKVPARSGYYKRVQKLHRLHHFKNEHYWYSFLVPWMDGWLGNDPDPGDVETSPTARDLLGEKQSAA